MNRLVLLVIAIVFPLMSFAQKERQVSGEYTYYAPLNVTPNEAKETAIEKAKLQALADAFGTLIDMHSTSVIQNDNGKSNSNFLSLGESTVKGEWLGDREEPETQIINVTSEFMIVHAKVRGLAREIVSARIDINAKLLKNTDSDYDEDQFHGGDNLYLSFKSPAKGYLAVYQMDKDNAYCLLPYENDDDGQFSVKANKSYVFFTKEQFEEQTKKDEGYTMTCEKPGIEQNLVYIIFSPNKFIKANDDESNGIVKVNGASLRLPRSLSFSDFQKWLLKCRRADKDMQVVIKSITIRCDE